MFALVIELIGPSQTRDSIREAHVRYSELAKDHPGILYKHVMHSTDDPARFFDVMVWETQEQSEIFGVDPEYQKHRSGPIRVPPPIHAWANPGYFREVWEVGSTTSAETEQYLARYEVTPGKEMAFEAEAAAIRDRIGGRVTSLILYRSLGAPNRDSIVMQGHSPDDEAALAPLAEFALRAPDIQRGEIIVRYDFR